MILLEGNTISTGYLAAATSHSVALPVGVTAGEMLCIYCMTSEDNRKVIATGYTAEDLTFTVSGTNSHTLLWLEATGAESGNVSVSFGGGSAALVAHAFRLSGVDTTDPFNTNNYTNIDNATSTATPSFAASTLTSLAGSAFLVAIGKEANRSVSSFDADFDTEIGSTAGTMSLHLYLDETESGTTNPQYDFTMSSSASGFGQSIFEIKATAVSSLTLDSSPSTIAKGQTSVQYTVSNASTAPTTSNTTATLGGQSLGNPTLVTGTGPWILSFDIPLDIALQAGSYTTTIEIES